MDYRGMLSSQSDRSERWRMAVFIAVACLHLFAGILIVEATRFRTVTPPEQYIALTFLPVSAPRRPSTGISPSQVPSSTPVSKKRESSNVGVQDSTAEPNNAITVPN